MILTVVHREGARLYGWDGYNNQVSVADRVGQQLCYVKSVRLELAPGAPSLPWDGGYS